jgi:AcrR family transcriptional regulator
MTDGDTHRVFSPRHLPTLRVTVFESARSLSLEKWLVQNLQISLNSNERMNQIRIIPNSPPAASNTRERILSTAESLFMRHGFDGASMRQITAEAQVNLAAVNYHFGSKEALIQEVFKRRLHHLNQARLDALTALEREAGDQPVKPSRILDAFFGTLLRMAKDEPVSGPTFLRLLGRTLTDPSDFIRAFLSSEYQHVIERYKAALFKALPDVPQEDIIWRFHFMLGATAYAIAGTDTLRVLTSWEAPAGGHLESTDDIDRLIPRLMSFLIGGLRAPLPESGQPAKRTADQRPRSREGGPVTTDTTSAGTAQKTRQPRQQKKGDSRT